MRIGINKKTVSPAFLSLALCLVFTLGGAVYGALQEGPGLIEADISAAVDFKSTFLLFFLPEIKAIVFIALLALTLFGFFAAPVACAVCGAQLSRLLIIYLGDIFGIFAILLQAFLFLPAAVMLCTETMMLSARFCGVLWAPGGKPGVGLPLRLILIFSIGCVLAAISAAGGAALLLAGG